MHERLPASLEAMAIIRRVQSDGGFAAILKKGDPDRGALTLILRGKGELKGILERELGPDFQYRWALKKGSEAMSCAGLDDFIASRRRLDADLWLIELDIAQPERFIAETILEG